MSHRRPTADAPIELPFQPTPLDFDAPPADPVEAFRVWYADALQLPVPNPQAMTLATVDADGQPSARVVLLRGFDARGAVFFTNRLSRKGAALKANPRAALLFHWDLLDRQVRIEGEVSLAGDDESDRYFGQRAVISQIGAWASDQSQPIQDRAALERRFHDMERRFGGAPVPRPPHWGGYRVSLGSIEFWQGERHRLHDRIVYRRMKDGWAVQRLCP